MIHLSCQYSNAVNQADWRWLVEARVRQALQMVDLAEQADKPPNNLSLGQKKRAAITGVLAMDSELLVFDELFCGLDPAFARQLMELLEMLFNEGRTIIIATHDVDMAYAWAVECLQEWQGSSKPIPGTGA